MGARLRGLYAITPDCPDGQRLPGERVARAHALRRLTQAFGARLLINDDMALAFLVDADGVHLGKDDGNLRAARAILGPDRLLGASCYADFAAARRAADAGADYVAFGAVHPSATKPQAVPPLFAAGADLLAVITDLFGAPDIAARAAAYQQLFEEASA